MSTRRLVVSRHAVEQYRARLKDERSAIEIGNEIYEAVLEARAARRVSNHKRHGFGLYGHRDRALPKGQQFVWRPDQRVAWIVACEPDEDTVVTTLTRTGISRRIAA